MNNKIVKFSINDGEKIKNYYETWGYVVVENVLSITKISKFINQYEKIKRNPLFLYYSQSIHLPIRPTITPEGFVEESMSNPTFLKLFPRFSRTILDCLIDQNVSALLTTLSGSPDHKMWQNMFFDKSTGTIEHQDHYYLDTDPPGHLIGVWYALEDIQEEAGCFFVIPGSHKGQVMEAANASINTYTLEERFPDHDSMKKEIVNLIKNGKYEYKAFPLAKGDVLFWHPYTIHGSYSNQNPQFSRKSFTAHFYPAHLPRLKALEPPMKKSCNPAIYIQGEDLKRYASNVKLYLFYIINKLNHKEAIMDMRRNSYDDYSK